MTDFNKRFEEIMNSTSDTLTKNAVDALIDSASEPADFRKIERFHRLLSEIKVKSLKVSTK